jgi:TrpR-related protein YerC/YecD
MSFESKLKTDEMDALFQAVLALKDHEECYKFFEDICTINELQSIAQRLEVAKMLNEGVTYNEISRRTGASTATISRVNRCVMYGTGGYHMMLERIGRAK